MLGRRLGGARCGVLAPPLVDALVVVVVLWRGVLSFDGTGTRTAPLEKNAGRGLATALVVALGL